MGHPSLVLDAEGCASLTGRREGRAQMEGGAVLCWGPGAEPEADAKPAGFFPTKADGTFGRGFWGSARSLGYPSEALPLGLWLAKFSFLAVELGSFRSRHRTTF